MLEKLLNIISIAWINLLNKSITIEIMVNISILVMAKQNLLQFIIL